MDLEAYRKTFNRTSNFLKLIGAELTVLREGYAEVELVSQEKHQNVNGTVHGGILFSLADTAVGAASNSGGRASVTLEGKLNMIRPASVDGERLTAMARELHGGRRTGVYECRILGGSGKLVAEGLYTMFMLDQTVEQGG